MLYGLVEAGRPRRREACDAGRDYGMLPAGAHSVPTSEGAWAVCADRGLTARGVHLSGANLPGPVTVVSRPSVPPPGRQ